MFVYIHDYKQDARNEYIKYVNSQQARRINYKNKKKNLFKGIVSILPPAIMCFQHCKCGDNVFKLHVAFH